MKVRLPAAVIIVESCPCGIYELWANKTPAIKN